MKRLPLFVSVAGRRCLVVGGGTLAARKLQLLVAAGAVPTVVAPIVDDAVRALAEAHGGQVSLRGFDAGDVAGHILVIAATDDEAVNASVYEASNAAGILVNAVDDETLSSAIFPAIVDRDPITIAISTGGESPSLAARIRGWIESVLHPRIGDLAKFLGDARKRVAAHIPDADARREFYRELIDGPVAEALLRGNAADARAMMDARLAGAKQRGVGFVSLVGAGPGDPDLLTLKALRCLQRADHVLYDHLVGPEVLNYARREAKRTYVGKRAGIAGNRQSTINQMLVDAARSGERVVRLKGGDPFVFGRGGEEIETLAAAGIPFEIVPGITAALGCAAYAGIPLTHRNHAQSVRFVTGHRQDGQVNLDWPELARADQTLVFYMGLPGLAQICRALVDHGMAATTPAALISRATLPDQQVVTGTVATLPELVAAQTVKSPTTLIVGGVVGLRDTLAPR